jgi:hypothetical protein
MIFSELSGRSAQKPTNSFAAERSGVHAGNSGNRPRHSSFTQANLTVVKLVKPQNPIAQDVLGIMARYPDRTPTRYGERKLGNVAIEDSYIYPPGVAA